MKNLSNEELISKVENLQKQWYFPNSESDEYRPGLLITELCQRFKNQQWFQDFDGVANRAALELFHSVITESDHAKAKFGEQLEIPSIDPEFYEQYKYAKYDRKEFYAISGEEHAKALTDSAMAQKKLTWGHVAVEELAEVISCGNDKDRRVELIQLMSVCARWIAAIDYQATNGKS